MSNLNDKSPPILRAAVEADGTSIEVEVGPLVGWSVSRSVLVEEEEEVRMLSEVVLVKLEEDDGVERAGVAAVMSSVVAVVMRFVAVVVAVVMRFVAVVVMLRGESVTVVLLSGESVTVVMLSGDSVVMSGGGEVEVVVDGAGMRPWQLNSAIPKVKK